MGFIGIYNHLCNHPLNHSFIHGAYLMGHG